MVFIALLNGAPLASASSARAVSSNRFDCAGSSGWLALSGVASSAPEAASHEPVVHPAGLPLVPSSTGGSEPLGMKRRVLQLSSSADVTVDRFDAAMSDQDDDTIRIYDDDFTYDAHFEISGDFAPGEKWPYALEIVELLNAGFEVLARPPAAPEAVRLTDAPVAWLDEFGNTFPLTAWAKSEVKAKWRPLFLAAAEQTAPKE